MTLQIQHHGGVEKMSSMGEFYASVVELGKVGRNLVFGRCKSLPFFIVLGNLVSCMIKPLWGIALERVLKFIPALES